MNKDMIKSEIMVNDRKINVLRIDNKDYISLTDLARYANRLQKCKKCKIYFFVSLFNLFSFVNYD